MSYRQNYGRSGGYSAMSKAEYVEFMRGSIGDTATATFAEDEIDVPISRSYGSQRALAVAIHKIEYYMVLSTGRLTADGEQVHFMLSKKSKAAVARPSSDADVIDYANHIIGFVTSGMYQQKTPIIHDFQKPILIGNNKLYFGFYQTSGDVMGAGIRIHFTPRFVSDSQLMEALID